MSYSSCKVIILNTNLCELLKPMWINMKKTWCLFLKAILLIYWSIFRYRDTRFSKSVSNLHNVRQDDQSVGLICVAAQHGVSFHRTFINKRIQYLIIIINNELLIYKVTVDYSVNKMISL